MAKRYVLMKYMKGHVKFNYTNVILVLSEFICQIKLNLLIILFVIINVLKGVRKLWLIQVLKSDLRQAF